MRLFVRFFQTKVTTAAKAVQKIKAGDTILSGGFGLAGIPETMIKEICRHPELQNLTFVSNNAGFDGKGLDKVVASGQVSSMIMSYIGGSKALAEAYKTGKVEIHLTPQGTIAELCRAAASGAPAFFTATGVDTWVEQGKLPVKNDENGKCILRSEPKETKEFNGRKYIMEYPLHAEIALVKCWKADPLGNLVFRGTTKNFNVIFAKAAKYTIVEADEIVEIGDLTPEFVHVPGIHVDAVIKSTEPKYFEKLMTQEEFEEVASHTGPARLNIAKRAAKEFEGVDYVNLGIGLPTLAPNFAPKDTVILQSENGILGMGPYPTKEQADPDISNAGKESVTLDPGASVFGSDESFCMIRAGKINKTFLGAMEVSQYGDLANWAVPGNVKGMGGAMDLVSNPDKTEVIVLTTHTDKHGKSKIVRECSNPLTGAHCVSRIITDLAVFDVDKDEGLTLIEIQPGSTIEEVREKTEAPFKEAIKAKL